MAIGQFLHDASWLWLQLGRAKTVEENEHLVTDVEQYMHGLRDFFSCAVPTEISAHARAEGEIDVDVMINTILDAALRSIQLLGEHVQEP